MNINEECKKEYEKDKQKKLKQLKNRLRWQGANPKQWNYTFKGEEWIASCEVTHSVEITARLDYNYIEGNSLYFKVSYYVNNSIVKGMYHSSPLRYWSDAKIFAGNILENISGSLDK